MSAPDRLTRIALPLMVAGAVAISFAPIFVRLSAVGPIATAFYRLLLALPPLYLWMRAESRRDAAEPGPRNARDVAQLLLAGLWFAGDLAVWHWSIKLTSVANATLLGNFAPIFVTLGARFLFGERITRLFLVGLAAALAGTIVLLGEGLTLGPETMLGNAFGLATAVFYAAYQLSVGRLRKRFSTATVMSWSGAATCATLLPLALLAGETLAVPGPRAWLVLLALGWVSHVGGQGAIAFAFRHLPAAFGSVTLLLQPVLAALLAWGLLNESLSIWQGLGGALVLCGIALARRGSR